MRGIVADIRRILYKDLLFVDNKQEYVAVGADNSGNGGFDELEIADVPPIDWNWVDNPTDKTVGWSFLQDLRNRFEVDGQKWLALWILDSLTLSRRFVRRTTGDIFWIKRAIEQYKRAVDRFLEKLLVVMHFTGGQPSRAPEIMSLRHRNTANGGIRNIFIDQGLVVFVTMYHKNYERSGKLNLIQRYLPREVGGPLLHYIWLVLPFLECVQPGMPGDAEEIVTPASAFIWGDRSLIRVEQAGDSD